MQARAEPDDFQGTLWPKSVHYPIVLGILNERKAFENER